MDFLAVRFRQHTDLLKIVKSAQPSLKQSWNRAKIQQQSFACLQTTFKSPEESAESWTQPPGQQHSALTPGPELQDHACGAPGTPWGVCQCSVRQAPSPQSSGVSLSCPQAAMRLRGLLGTALPLSAAFSSFADTGQSQAWGTSGSGPRESLYEDTADPRQADRRRSRHGGIEETVISLWPLTSKEPVGQRKTLG